VDVMTVNQDFERVACRPSRHSAGREWGYHASVAPYFHVHRPDESGDVPGSNGRGVLRISVAGRLPGSMASILISRLLV
jgi:hypothetical protein